jgi:hypothetical protein
LGLRLRVGFYNAPPQIDGGDEQADDQCRRYPNQRNWFLLLVGIGWRFPRIIPVIGGRLDRHHAVRYPRRLTVCIGVIKKIPRVAAKDSSLSGRTVLLGDLNS